MTNHRYFTRKDLGFRNQEAALLQDLQKSLPQLGLKNLAIYTAYEVFEATEEDLAIFEEQILAGTKQDELFTSEELDILNPDNKYKFLGVTALEGQFDQRADVAEETLRLLSPGSEAVIRTVTLYRFETEDPGQQEAAYEALKARLLNPVVEKVRDFSRLALDLDVHIEPLRDYSGFRDLDEAGLEKFIADEGLAMSLADILMIQAEMKKIDRDPTEVEIKVLDTYWSDHCRHSTFNTQLTKIENKSEVYKEDIDRILVTYEDLREKNGRRDRQPSLMEMATIAARELRRQGKLDKLEVSDEINACSIYVDVETDQGTEPWLLMFKNETHNHPTEIEPFGGAGTCLGGAIRDPLSGRAYVYQALRLSGAGDINTPYEETLAGKLPQAQISATATKGYSDYGNQIGVAGTTVRELQHEGYVAKRMELGAVMAAAPRENVRRVNPSPGNIIILVGGRTGRDGVGGATGSSQAADRETAQRAGSEVQKGNPPAEAGIMRLFRRPEIAQLILKCNDFGAGGVSVAVGELADSLDINLDKVKTKYPGLNAMELAISESQERMAVLIDKKDEEKFLAACIEEDLEAEVIAQVTDTGYLRMTFQGETVFDLDRDFIETNGAQRSQEVVIEDLDNPVIAEPCLLGDLDKEGLLNHLADPNFGSQEGLIENFDSSVGRSTVLAPLGGRYQKTEEQISVQTLPVKDGTPTVSVMSYGYSTALADRSPYLMGAYSVIEAVAKLTAAGLDYNNAFLSNQEFFRRLDNDPVRWGRVTQSLLGLIEAQEAFGLASVGGKDSMSGTFEDIHVPDTLVSFAFMEGHVGEIIPATLNDDPSKLYYLPHTTDEDLRPNYDQLKANFALVRQLAQAGQILSASAIRPGGLAETVAKMSLGNRINIKLAKDLEEVDFCASPLGGIVIALRTTTNPEVFAGHEAIYLAECRSTEYQEGQIEPVITWKEGLVTSFEEIEEALSRAYRDLYPLNVTQPEDTVYLPEFAADIDHYWDDLEDLQAIIDSEVPESDHSFPERASVKVLIPNFYGQNGVEDMAAAFRAAGASTEIFNIRRLNADLVLADRSDFIKKLEEVDILALGGSYHLGDYPSSAGQYMASFFNQNEVKQALARFVQKDGLVLGINNGFQALVQTGFLPYGLEAPGIKDLLDPQVEDELMSALKDQGFWTEPSEFAKDSSVRFGSNPLDRHVSRMVKTVVRSTTSPWFIDNEIGDVYVTPYSTSQGHLVVSPEEAEELFAHGQIASQFVDREGYPTMDAPWNPAGADFAIEAISSPCGRILGKMAHPERSHNQLFINIAGQKEQPIFDQAVKFVLARKK